MNYRKFNKSKFSTAVYAIIKDYEPETAEELKEMEKEMTKIINEECSNYAWDSKEIDEKDYNGQAEAEWEQCEDEGSFFLGDIICSKCGNPALEEGERQYMSKYCPNCGAKMKKTRRKEK